MINYNGVSAWKLSPEVDSVDLTEKRNNIVVDINLLMERWRGHLYDNLAIARCFARNQKSAAAKG